MRYRKFNAEFIKLIKNKRSPWGFFWKNLEHTHLCQ